jgi:hypothetical protein
MWMTWFYKDNMLEKGPGNITGSQEITQFFSSLHWGKG